jgi:hypothetical protein
LPLKSESLLRLCGARSSGGGEFLEGFAVRFRGVRELRVPQGCPVASTIDGVHYGQSTAYAEGEAKEEAEDGWPVKSHFLLVYRAGATGEVRVGAGLVKILKAFWTV